MILTNHIRHHCDLDRYSCPDYLARSISIYDLCSPPVKDSMDEVYRCLSRSLFHTIWSSIVYGTTTPFDAGAVVKKT